MSEEEAAAQKARAERLRQQIDQLRNTGEDDSETEIKEPAPKPTSPRDFIHQRMHELDRE
jgi:hypothetical protein